MTFQKIVSIVALVLFVVILIIIAISMSGAKNEKKFPPVTGECPDYWIDQSKGGDGSKCINTKSLGTCMNSGKIPDAKTCHTDDCNIEGQSCPATTGGKPTPGSGGKNWLCCGGHWKEGAKTCPTATNCTNKGDCDYDNQLCKKDNKSYICCLNKWQEGSGPCVSSGGSSGNTMNFTKNPFTGKDGLCNKAKWARQCDLTWDGVTNNLTCFS
jgi:hypothetical protein